MNICLTCKNEFNANIHTPYQKYCCRKCQPWREYNNRWRKKYYPQIVERERERKELRRFGIRRKKILERDGNKCMLCNSTENLIIHHKDGNGRRKKIKNNHPANLITLCSSCHAKLHNPKGILTH